MPPAIESGGVEQANNLVALGQEILEPEVAMLDDGRILDGLKLWERLGQRSSDQREVRHGRSAHL